MPTASRGPPWPFQGWHATPTQSNALCLTSSGLDQISGHDGCMPSSGLGPYTLGPRL